MTAFSAPRGWVHVALGAVLLACLWIGWHDFDPWMSQEAVRGSIRGFIRGAVQLLVQYLIPLAILACLIRSALPGVERDAGGG